MVVVNDQNETMLDKKSSRRSFIKNSGIAVGGLVLGGSLGSIFTSKQESSPEVIIQTDGQAVDYSESLQFFRRQTDFDAISAAMETIFPKDEKGPGAIELGAPYYLDKQLAGPWGINADDYRKGPFQPGEMPLNNGEIFLAGARSLNSVAISEYDATSFNQLEEEQKIALLTKYEAGEIEIPGVPSAAFFTMLRAATLQGCYCDPMYGGNKNMAGWSMKEFPGAQMSYLQYAESEEFVLIPPVSVGGHSHS